MTYLIIDLGNKTVECKANLSYIDNHIVLAFQAKGHMLEITGFITDCFNNGDLLEKFNLQYDDEKKEFRFTSGTANYHLWMIYTNSSFKYLH